MGTKKTAKHRYKPYRAVRIPEHMAKLMEELAKENFSTLSVQVRQACLAWLRSNGKLPSPS